jgi:hypothetical protein
MESVLLLNRGAHEVVLSAAPEQHQVLTKHRVEPLMEQCNLLLISVRVVGAILREVVEPLAILVDTPRTLLQVHELLKLMGHQTRGDVMSTEGLVELGPRHLVAVLKSGGEVSPPSIGRPMKLLGCV